MKLTGVSLNLTLPDCIIKRPLMYDGAEDIQSFIERLFAKVETFDTKQGSYLMNQLVIPIVIENMITTNNTFEEAINSSKETANELFEHLRYLKDSTMFEGNLEEGIRMLFYALQQIPQSLHLPKGCYTVSLNNICEDVANAISDSGIFVISEMVASNPNIKELIKHNLILPMSKAIILRLNDEEFESYVLKKFGHLYHTLPVQTVLSFILTKAINENISFTNALASYNREDLAALAVDELHYQLSTILPDAAAESIVDAVFAIADME